jgi:hypothetical protein
MSQPTYEVRGTPEATQMPLIIGFMPSRVVHLAAQLGLADRLADGPKEAHVLASQTGTHAPSLHRLLRALASIGVVDEREPGYFALTPLGSQLRTGVPRSLRSLALLYGGDRAWHCWGGLLHSVRTGETAMQHLYGQGSFDYLAAHPDQAAVFNHAMSELTYEVAQAVAAAYDFTQFRSIVDVGGGNGMLMTAVLASAPVARGIVFDLPAGNAEAARQLAAAGCRDRCDVVEGDFFHSVPNGADAYILKSIIHDWDDDRSVAILRNCCKAMSAGSKLLLVERLMPMQMNSKPSHRRMAMLDMNMMAMPGGRERTEPEYRALLSAGGFRLSRILPLSTISSQVDASIIEAVPGK